MRRGENEEYVYGINAIRALISAHRESLHALLIARDKRDPRLRTLLSSAAEAGIPVHARPTAVLSKLVGNHHHQGLVAVVAGFAYSDLETLLEHGRAVDNPLYILLDGVQDPGNLGAVIRSAFLFGAQGLIMPKDRAVGVTPAVRKAAAGGAERLPIARVSNLGQAMAFMSKNYGVWMLALDQNAPDPIYAHDLRRPLGLVVGGEAKGMRPSIKKRCEMTAHIPRMIADHSMDSLNVSVAAGIALYEVRRQGGSSKGAL